MNTAIDSEIDFSHWIDEHEFKYDSFNRERMVRNILCDMKGYLDVNQDIFDITFEKIDFVGKGFGFRFEITPMSDISDDTTNPYYKTMYHKVSDYVRHMFSYIFNNEIDVLICEENNNLRTVFEITSQF